MHRRSRREAVARVLRIKAQGQFRTLARRGGEGSRRNARDNPRGRLTATRRKGPGGSLRRGLVLRTISISAYLLGTHFLYQCHIGRCVFAGHFILLFDGKGRRDDGLVRRHGGLRHEVEKPCLPGAGTTMTPFVATPHPSPSPLAFTSEFVYTLTSRYALPSMICTCSNSAPLIAPAGSCPRESIRTGDDFPPPRHLSPRRTI